jgi:predicted ATPase/class 3 adenylate cyclase
VAQRELPTGTLTFFFSDIEGSTKLVQRLGLRFKDLLERHEALVREAYGGTGATEVRTVGDAFFIVFPTADAAVKAAVAAQRAHATEPWPEDGVIRMRVGLHTGLATRGGDDYVGIDVHLAARIAGASHGGQIVVSDQTRTLLREPGDGIDLRDLGDHRLKDVGSLRLWQVVAPGIAERFPPLASLEVPTNLPADATDFIGREREVGEIRDLVRASRLVTLTGPGGTGKTRLSLRVAREVTPEFPHGVFFVPLEPIRDPALVPATIAHALDLPEEASRSASEVLKERLRDRSTLLVLDNFEQVTGAAPMVGDLLKAAPRVRCLASSREVLHVYGEQEYPVPVLSDEDALTLFTQRAQMANPRFALTEVTREVARAIVARLDRLPLAIELAAARMKVFSIEALLTRLEKSLSVLTSGARDLPERQRTLRGAIAWSYDLLSEGERAIFRRLGVFVGGCRIETAERVCDPDGVLDVTVVDALPAFVDKSLLRCDADADGETRFTMLLTIREYALERLNEAGETADARRRHAEWVLALAEEAKPVLTAGEDAPIIARLAEEHDNVRAAIAWALDTGEAGIGMRIAEGIWRFWQQRGHLAEGRALLERLLALPAAAAPTVERAKGLAAMAGLAYWQSDFAPLPSAYKEALEIHRRVSTGSDLAEAVYNAAFVGFTEGDIPAARRYLEEGRDLYAAAGDASGVSAANEALAALFFRTQDTPAAVAAQSAVVAHRRSQRNAFRLVDSLTLYSLLLLESERTDEGLRTAREGLALARERGNVAGTIGFLLILARHAVGKGRPADAARICGAVDVLREQTSVGGTPIEVLGLTQPHVDAEAALGPAAYARERAAGRRLSLDEAEALALR